MKAMAVVKLIISNIIAFISATFQKNIPEGFSFGDVAAFVKRYFYV